MNSLTNRFYIALLPPPEIFAHINSIQQYFAEHYASRGALSSPPHITLQPPFEWGAENVLTLKQCLATFADSKKPFPINLDDFEPGAPWSICIHVATNLALESLQADLTASLETQLGIVDQDFRSRSFHPHVTVACRDLTEDNFLSAWALFQQRPFQFEFTATQMTLLLHDGSRWNVCEEFPFH